MPKGKGATYLRYTGLKEGGRDFVSVELHFTRRRLWVRDSGSFGTRAELGAPDGEQGERGERGRPLQRGRCTVGKPGDLTPRLVSGSCKMSRSPPPPTRIWKALWRPSRGSTTCMVQVATESCLTAASCRRLLGRRRQAGGMVQGQGRG